MKYWGTYFFVLLFSHSLLAENIRVEFLDTPAEVLKEYCRTQPLGPFKDCSAGTISRMVNIYFPEKLGLTVLSHINKAKKAKYYDTIGMTDFFHGHIVLKGPQTEYTPESYFDDFSAVLYHSAEYTGRWHSEELEGLSYDERTPRSFVGWLDGEIQKAIELIPASTKLTDSYYGAGTIYINEVIAARPELTKHTGITSNSYTPLTMRACNGQDCRTCIPFGAFQIVQEPTGRFVSESGEKIELYMRCYYPTDH